MRAVVCLGMLAACSFATMRSPESSPPRCTDSNGAPLIDLAFAIATPFVVYEAVTANMSPPGENADGAGPSAATLTGVFSAPVMALFVSSAIYGNVKASGCSRAKREYRKGMIAPSPPPAP